MKVRLKKSVTPEEFLNATFPEEVIPNFQVDINNIITDTLSGNVIDFNSLKQPHEICYGYIDEDFEKLYEVVEEDV